MVDDVGDAQQGGIPCELPNKIGDALLGMQDESIAFR